MGFAEFKGSNSIKASRSLFNERGKYNNEGVPPRYLEKYPGVFRNFWTFFLMKTIKNEKKTKNFPRARPARSAPLAGRCLIPGCDWRRVSSFLT